MISERCDPSIGGELQVRFCKGIFQFVMVIVTDIYGRALEVKYL